MKRFSVLLETSISKNDFDYWSEPRKKSRFDVFVNKIKNGMEFIGSGNLPNVTIDPAFAKTLERLGSSKELKALPKYIPLSGGGTIKWSSLEKTKEFGGRKSAQAKAVNQKTLMPGTANIDSTRQEINICYGFTRLWAEKNRKYGIDKHTSHADAWKILNDNKAFGGVSYKNSESNYGINAFESGYKTAKSSGKSPQPSFATSGGRVKVGLNPIYTRFGASSTEPKADLMIGGDKVSVKKEKGSQVGSMQASEATAVFHFALENVPDDKFNEHAIESLIYKSLTPEGWKKGRAKFGKDASGSESFDKFMNNILRGEVSPKKRNINKINVLEGNAFQDAMISKIEKDSNNIGKNIKTETIQAYVLNDNHYTKFMDTVYRGKTMTERIAIWKFGSAVTKKGKPRKINKNHVIEYFDSGPQNTVKDVLKFAKSPLIHQIQEALKELWMMPIPEINESIIDYISSPKIKEYVAFEASTGYNKFNKSTLAVADKMLVWGASGRGEYFDISNPNSPKIKSMGEKMTIRFSDRGNNRGGSIRLELKEEHLSQLFNLTEEQQQQCDAFADAYVSELNENTLTEEYLIESIFSSIGSGLKISSTVKRWGSAVMAAIKQFISYINKLFANIIATFAVITMNAFNNSNMSAMKLFGFARTITFLS